jgi:hypothetical protein
MTYDESNAALTMGLCGRTIDHILRLGKELHFVCTDSHIIVIQADTQGDIHFKRRDVRIVLPGLNATDELGRFGRG